MIFRYVIEAQVEREEGKFASRDELGDQLLEALEGADPGSLDGDEGGTYTVDAREVEEAPEEKGGLTPAERDALTTFLSTLLNDGLDTYGLSGAEKAALRRGAAKLIAGKS